MSKMNELRREQETQAEFFRNYELAEAYESFERRKTVYEIIMVVLVGIIIILLSRW